MQRSPRIRGTSSLGTVGGKRVSMLPLYRPTSFLLTGTSGAGGDELADGPGGAGLPRMSRADQWRKEPGARLEGSRPLDRAKLQAPCAVCLPGGGLRLFYTA